MHYVPLVLSIRCRLFCHRSRSALGPDDGRTELYIVKVARVTPLGGSELPMPGVAFF